MPIGALLQYLLPRRLALGAARLCVRLAFPWLKSQRRSIAENFERIVGRVMSRPEADRRARRVLENLAVANADLLRAPALLRRRQLASLVVCTRHRQALDTVLKAGRGAILVTAHLGNWDLAGVFVASEGYPIVAVFERIPRGLSSVFNRFRGSSGMGLIGLDEREKMIAAIRSGKLFVVLGDRDLKGNGLELAWFSGRRTFPRGAAAFALRYDVPVVIGHFVFEPGDRFRRYRIEVGPPLEFVPTGDMARDIEALTARIVRELELLVRRYPEQWFVFQPNWRPGLAGAGTGA
jgi:KDO2-lipid IV(A) lauroyltransferase